MEDNSNQAIVVAELRDHLRDIDQKVPIDWTQVGDESLLKCFAILLCWSVDGMIRICEVSDDIQVTDNPESWASVIQDVNRRRDMMTLNDLAKLHSEGVEFPAVLLLGWLKMQFDRVRREILRRAELRPVGRQIVFWTDRFPNFKEQDLLNAFKPPKTIPARGKRIRLSDPFRNSPSDSKEREQQSLNVSTALEFYEGLKTELTQGSSLKVPFSPIANTYPAKPEIWEKAFPKLIQEQIDAHVAELLPILNGEMEKIPLVVFDAYRDAFRKELSWGRLKESERFRHEELARQELASGSEDALHLERAQQKFSKNLNELISKAPLLTRPKRRKAIAIYLDTGSIAKSARESDLDKDTVRKDVIALNLHSLRSVPKRRKGK